MSKQNSLSRRESLLGIGAAGTVLGGSALGISNVMAGDDSKTDTENGDADKHEKGDTENGDDKKATTGFELTVLCYEKGSAKFRVDNETKQQATVDWKTDTDDVSTDDSDANGAENGTEGDEDFDPDGETIEDGEEVDGDGDDNGDTSGDNGDDNGETNGHNGDDSYHLKGNVTVPKHGSETFWADVVSKDASVSLYYDGKKVATEAVEHVDCEKKSVTDKFDLEAVCYRTRKEHVDDTDDEETDDSNGAGEPGSYTTTLTVGSDNDGDSLNDIVADYSGTGADLSNVEDQDVSVEQNGTAVTDDLDEVSASNEGQTLTLGFGGSYSLEEGDEIVVSLENVQDPPEAGEYEATYTLNSQSAAETTTTSFTVGEGDDDADDDDDGEDTVVKTKEAKFRVDTEFKKQVKANWSVDGDKQGGKLYFDNKSPETFWVTVLEGQKTYATITYDGKEVATTKADTTTSCSEDC